MDFPIRRILVVDDDRDTVDTFAMALRLDGHEVDVAYDGVTAVDAAKRLRPEVMFLDVSMPKMSGHEVARQLKALDGRNDMKIVACTGYATANDRLSSLVAGCDAHFPKPLEIDQVRKFLAQL